MYIVLYKNNFLSLLADTDTDFLTGGRNIIHEVYEGRCYDFESTEFLFCVSEKRVLYDIIAENKRYDDESKPYEEFKCMVGGDITFMYNFNCPRLKVDYSDERDFDFIELKYFK